MTDNLTPAQRRSVQAASLVAKQHAEALAHEYERLVTYLVQQEYQLLAQAEREVVAQFATLGWPERNQ